MAIPPRICLLHATPVAMMPVASAMERLWPTADAFNLLDDALSADRAKEGDTLSEALTERFVDMGRYACRAGADGILVTCSAFGTAIDRMADALPVPVVKPNEAMFRAAMAAGRRIGMLATFAPSVATMTEEFDAFKAEMNADATLTTIVVDRAIDLLRKGDADAHNSLVAHRAPEFAEFDAIMLAHFSTSRAAEMTRACVSVPVFCAPDAAVERMMTHFSEV